VTGDRDSPGRRANRRNVFNIALVGVVLLGFSGWSLISSGGSETVLVSSVFGVVALAAAVVGHRILLRRDEI